MPRHLFVFRGTVYLVLLHLANIFSAGSCLAFQGQSSDITPLEKKTYIYKKVGDVAISADVYRPANAEPRPVVVWIHGGALIVGSRSQIPKGILELCTRERFILVSFDYRLAPEVKLPEIAADVRDAFQWLHQQGPELFHSDSGRIVVTGGSAGGFLTMLSGVIIKPKPTALVAYWGYGDIDAKWATDYSEHYRTKTPLVDPKEALSAVNQGKILTNTDDPAVQKSRGNYYRYLRQIGGWSRAVTGIDAAQEPGKLKAFCPVQQIAPDYPPIMMIHGTSDTDVPYECSAKMVVELKKHGVEHVLATVEGAEHGLRDGDPQTVSKVNQQALEFIQRHLSPKSSRTELKQGADRNFAASRPTSERAADVHAAADNKTVTSSLAAISRVRSQGVGSAEARAATAVLSTRGIEILPQLLTAMDTENTVAANWFRSIYEDLIQRESARSDVVWPIAFLKEYVGDRRRAGRPRRLVLALIDKLEKNFSGPWLPTRLDDPEFRYEAVGIALTAGTDALNAKQTEVAKQKFRAAFENARNSSQVTEAASKLQSLGEPANVTKHLGLVVDWWLIGPFDAPEKSGFAKVFPPETQVDLQATYPSQAGDQCAWVRHHADDVLGQLNLVTVFGPTREAVAYAYTEIEVDEWVTALLCCGADDNCTVWFNDKKVLARDQWLNGIRFDRFITPVELQRGKNRILVKICQGPQHKDPEVPNNWSMHLRLCDNDGRGIAFRPSLTK